MLTKLDNYYLYVTETEEMCDIARDTLKDIMLGPDALGKKTPYDWMKDDVEKHLYKALGHIIHHLKQRAKYEKEDQEYHLKNALNRVVMALAIEKKENGMDKKSSNK